MKKLIFLFTLLTLAAPAFAEQPLTIIGQRMKIHATRPDDQASPRHIWPLVRYHYSGHEPIEIKYGWQILNGNNAVVTQVEKRGWIRPGQTLSLQGPDFFDYSGAILKLRGYASDTSGKVIVERSSAPEAQR